VPWTRPRRREDVMKTAELIPDYIQAIAILAAGLWAYWTFFKQRGHEPATDIEVEAAFPGRQDGQVLLEVTVVLESKGLVRHPYDDIRLRVRYLMPGDSIRDSGERTRYQLVFRHNIDARIRGARRTFGNAEYINPRQRFRHRYETFLPEGATFVLVHCGFDLPQSKWRAKVRRLLRREPPKAVSVDAQRVFRVPPTTDLDVPTTALEGPTASF
jgi:hypothetical protein